MHGIRLRERERLSHEPCHPLPECTVESLDMTGLPCPFADRMMLLFGQQFW